MTGENSRSIPCFTIKTLPLADVRHLRDALNYAIGQHPGDPRRAEWLRIYAKITEEAEAYCQSILCAHVKPAPAEKPMQ